jgi:hypothetical protein
MADNRHRLLSPVATASSLMRVPCWIAVLLTYSTKTVLLLSEKTEEAESEKKGD